MRETKQFIVTLHFLNLPKSLEHLLRRRRPEQSENKIARLETPRISCGNPVVGSTQHRGPPAVARANARFGSDLDTFVQLRAAYVQNATETAREFYFISLIQKEKNYNLQK